MDFLSPYYTAHTDMCKHIRFIMKYAQPTQTEISAFKLRTQVARIKKDSHSVTDALESLFICLLKRSKINFIVKNLPSIGTNAITNLPEIINARSMHDTLDSFGSVNNVVVFKNTAYVWFANDAHAKHSHLLLNNMAVDKHIIKTSCVPCGA